MRENFESVFNNIIIEAKDGRFIIDGEDKPISFNTIIKNGSGSGSVVEYCNEENSSCLVIDNRERFKKLLEEYVRLARSFEINIQQDSQRNAIRWVVYKLFVNATAEEFRYPCEYIKMKKREIWYNNTVNNRKQYINTKMISAIKEYSNFINRIKSPNGFFNLEFSSSLIETYNNDSNNIFLDLLVANISLLLPIVIDNYLSNSNISDLFDKYDNFFNRYNSDYSLERNEDGSLVTERTICNELRDSAKKALNNFRNALQHGRYSVYYDDNDAFIKYDCKSGGITYYKKVPLKTVISIISDMIDFDYGNNMNNRLVCGIINNMKLIYQTLKHKHNFRYVYNLLEGYYLKNDNCDLFEDMKITLSFLEFYVYYQKHLEGIIGPDRSGISVYSKDKPNVAWYLFYEIYLDILNLDLGKFINATPNVDSFDFQNIINRLNEERGMQVDSNVVPFSLQDSPYLRIRYFVYCLKKLSTLHHIRNSFAHGRVTIDGDLIRIEDKKRDNTTYFIECSIEDFKKLLNRDNEAIIENHLGRSK